MNWAPYEARVRMGRGGEDAVKKVVGWIPQWGGGQVEGRRGDHVLDEVVLEGGHDAHAVLGPHELEAGGKEGGGGGTTKRGWVNRIAGWKRQRVGQTGNTLGRNGKDTSCVIHVVAIYRQCIL